MKLKNVLSTKIFHLEFVQLFQKMEENQTAAFELSEVTLSSLEFMQLSNCHYKSLKNVCLHFSSSIFDSTNLCYL